MKKIKALKLRVGTAKTEACHMEVDQSAASARIQLPSQVKLQVGIETSPRVELIGFAKSLSQVAAAPWVIPNVLQKTGVVCVTCPPHLTNAARCWITSTLSGAASVGDFRVEEPVAQAIVLLNQPGPAELSAMTTYLAAQASAPTVQLHLLCNGTQGVSVAERAFVDLIRNRLKPQGSSAKAPAVIHLTVRPSEFAKAVHQEAVVEHVRTLQRAGFSLIVYWEESGTPTWSLPPGLADTSLTISKHHRPESEKAFKAVVSASRFVDGDTLPPMSVYVIKKDGLASAEWMCEQYISDDPLLLKMYRMKSSGATMKQIGAALDVDPSTVCRNLKALEKDLVAR